MKDKGRCRGRNLNSIFKVTFAYLRIGHLIPPSFCLCGQMIDNRPLNVNKCGRVFYGG